MTHSHRVFRLVRLCHSAIFRGPEPRHMGARAGLDTLQGLEPLPD